VRGDKPLEIKRHAGHRFEPRFFEPEPLVRIKASLAIKGPAGFASEKAPKTKSSKRAIPVHSTLGEALKQWKTQGWRAYVGRDLGDDDPIFPDESGRPWRPRSAELLRADLERAKLPTEYEGALIDTRVFRRSFATWLEACGVPGTHIDSLLEHAQQTVRGRHYSAAHLGVAALRGRDDPP
jgi:integrase